MVGSFVSLVRATDFTGRRTEVVSTVGMPIDRALVINSPETGFTSLIFAVRQAGNDAIANPLRLRIQGVLNTLERCLIHCLSILD